MRKKEDFTNAGRMQTDQPGLAWIVGVMVTGQLKTNMKIEVNCICFVEMQSSSSSRISIYLLLILLGKWTSLGLDVYLELTQGDMGHGCQRA